MRAFVTVGTTKFDALVAALDTDACLSALVARGFTSLRMQIGHGEHEPRASFPGLELSFYRHDPQYKRDVARADLVISHAGAGSIMDGLALGKKLLVVVNTALMDNHQAELAEAMADKKYCLQTSVQGLQHALESGDWDCLQPYPQPDEEAFPDLVDAVMGVAEASKEQ
jgi:beta-1,4-N-acetylglucosaminyltransferase